MLTMPPLNTVIESRAMRNRYGACSSAWGRLDYGSKDENWNENQETHFP